MFEKAQMFTPDQIQSFIIVMGGMALANAGSICASVYQYFRRIRKLRKDTNAAHSKIRELEVRIECLEEVLNIADKRTES